MKGLSGSALLAASIGAMLCCWMPQCTEASCNEALCASLVSKCLLMKSCECDMSDKKNCTCCSHCSKCLAKRYPYCCACVGLCDSLSASDTVLNASSIEELSDPIPDLFNMLTTDDTLTSPDGMWTVHRYPAYESLLQLHHKTPQMSLNEDVMLAVANARNCTTAYVNKCTSLRVCKEMCKSMGAAKLRWFHEHGCCECVDSHCLDYGKSRAMCTHCPVSVAGADEFAAYDEGEPEFDAADEIDE